MNGATKCVIRAQPGSITSQFRFEYSPQQLNIGKASLEEELLAEEVLFAEEVCLGDSRQGWPLARSCPQLWIHSQSDLRKLPGHSA